METFPVIIAALFAGWCAATRTRLIVEAWGHILGGYVVSLIWMYGMILHWNGVRFGWHPVALWIAVTMTTPQYLVFLFVSVFVVRKIRE